MNRPRRSSTFLALLSAASLLAGSLHAREFRADEERGGRRVAPEAAGDRPAPARPAAGAPGPATITGMDQIKTLATPEQRATATAVMGSAERGAAAMGLKRSDYTLTYNADTKEARVELKDGVKATVGVRMIATDDAGRTQVYQTGRNNGDKLQAVTSKGDGGVTFVFNLDSAAPRTYTSDTAQALVLNEASANDAGNRTALDSLSVGGNARPAVPAGGSVTVTVGSAKDHNPAFAAANPASLAAPVLLYNNPGGAGVGGMRGDAAAIPAGAPAAPAKGLPAAGAPVRGAPAAGAPPAAGGRQQVRDATNWAIRPGGGNPIDAVDNGDGTTTITLTVGQLSDAAKAKVGAAGAGAAALPGLDALPGLAMANPNQQISITVVKAGPGANNFDINATEVKGGAVGPAGAAAAPAPAARPRAAAADPVAAANPAVVGALNPAAKGVAVVEKQPNGQINLTASFNQLSDGMKAAVRVEAAKDPKGNAAAAIARPDQRMTFVLPADAKAGDNKIESVLPARGNVPAAATRGIVDGTGNKGLVVIEARGVNRYQVTTQAGALTENGRKQMANEGLAIPANATDPITIEVNVNNNGAGPAQIIAANGEKGNTLKAAEFVALPNAPVNVTMRQGGDANQRTVTLKPSEMTPAFKKQLTDRAAANPDPRIGQAVENMLAADRPVTVTVDVVRGVAQLKSVSSTNDRGQTLTLAANDVAGKPALALPAAAPGAAAPGAGALPPAPRVAPVGKADTKSGALNVIVNNNRAAVNALPDKPTLAQLNPKTGSMGIQVANALKAARTDFPGQMGNPNSNYEQAMAKFKAAGFDPATQRFIAPPVARAQPGRPAPPPADVKKLIAEAWQLLGTMK